MTRIDIPLFVALAASILAAADARDTLPYQRMIRKRTPAAFGKHVAFASLPRFQGLSERADLLPGLGGPNAADDDNTQPSGTGSTSKAAATQTSSASSARPTSAPANTPTSSPVSNSAPPQSTTSASTTSGGLLDSLTGILGGTQTTTSASSTSTISSSSSVASTSSISSAAPTTSKPADPISTPTLNIATPPPATNTVAQSITFVTSTEMPEASQQAASTERTRKITKNTIISLVVVAACIGGAVAIWTVIRKWKLSPSERFDDRMQPIDWAPTTAGAGMRDETMEEKRNRRGSTGSHGSFTSGGVGQSELGHGAGARSVYSDQAGHGAQHAADFPPAHDFTAGAANGYGQYYQGQQQYGYADLQRGPSVTESSYSHGASVTRGLSYSRGGNGGYEAQPGAAGVPPMPNPYGGGYEYEDYGHQAGHVQGQGQYRGY